MNNPENNKEGKVKVCDNKSVGMLIWRDKKLLLIERKLFPFGFAPPAGHIDDKGGFDEVAREEVQEEVGLKPTSIKLIAEGRKENRCRRKGGNYHYWKIYEVKAEGELSPSEDETKQAGWYTKEQISKLSERTTRYINGQINEEDWESSPGIETVWYEWFRELDII